MAAVKYLKPIREARHAAAAAFSAAAADANADSRKRRSLLLCRESSFFFRGGRRKSKVNLFLRSAAGEGGFFLSLAQEFAVGARALSSAKRESQPRSGRLPDPLASLLLQVRPPILNAPKEE